MVFKEKLYTVEEFLVLTQLPEYADQKMEYIDGTVYIVTANQKSSAAGAWIIAALGVFMGDEDLGDITGADGGYIVAGSYVNPDVAFVSRQRQSEPPDVTYNPLVPDFAAEVISPSDLEHPTERIEKKLKKYQIARIRLLWMVYPIRQEVEVYVNGEYQQTVGLDAILDGGEVLLGFKLPVKRIFRK